MVKILNLQGSGEEPSALLTTSSRYGTPMTSLLRKEGLSRDQEGLNNETTSGGSAAFSSAASIRPHDFAFSAFATSNYSSHGFWRNSSVNSSVATAGSVRKEEALTRFDNGAGSAAFDIGAVDLFGDSHRTFYATATDVIDYLPANGTSAYSSMEDVVANATTVQPFTSFSNASTELDKSALRALGITIGFINMFVGSSGNLLTILAIMWNKKLRTTFHIFIANLCVIDFLTSAAMMPFNITAYWTKAVIPATLALIKNTPHDGYPETLFLAIKKIAAWPFGEDSFTCSFMAFSYYCCGYTSIVCLLVITVNRFVGIVYPEHYDDLFTRGRIILAIIISWIFAPAFLFPIFFFASNRGYGWYQALTLCVFRTDRYNPAEQNYMQFIRVLFQFLPLIIMGVLYVKIFLTSQRAGKAVLRMSKKSLNSSGGDARKSGSNRGGIKFPTYKSKGRVASNPSESETKISEDDSVMKSIDQENETSRMNTAREDDSKPDISAVYVPASPTSEAAPESSSVFSHRKKQWQKKRVFSNSQVKRMTPSSSSSTNRHPHKFKRQYTATEKEARKRRSMDRKLLRISVTICITFMILFLPSVIVNLIPKSVGIDPRVHMFASVMTWFNSCVNPIIYCFMNARMRSQYKLLLMKAWNSVCWCVPFNTRRTWAQETYNSSFRSSRHT